MRVSVIVSTYNWPGALDRALHALSEQRSAPFEVIVADDGSTAETAALVQDWQRRFPVPLHHAWQPDEGFRVGAVRNLAARRAQGEWLQFLDGDCVPRPTFIERVARLARPGHLIAGDRILLSKGFTEAVVNNRLPIHAWPARRWVGARLRGDANRLLPLVWWPSGHGRGLGAKRWLQFRGANAGASAADFAELGGFDERMIGWGYEDSEFAVRAIRRGLRITSGRLGLGVFHLWHPERARDALERNAAILRMSETADG